MGALRVELGRVWAEHSPPAERGREWCAPIQPGDVRDSIMTAVACRTDGATSMEEFFADTGWTTTRRLTEIAQDLAEGLWARRETLPLDKQPAVSKRDVSEWAAGVVAGPYRDENGFPDAEYLAAAAVRFWATRTGPQAEARRAARISAETFAGTYRSAYDALWEEHGEASLRILCPPKLGLGRLLRPPLVAPRNSWRSGTDRDVHSRYHHYVRRRDWPRNLATAAERAGHDLDRHISVRLLSTDPDTLARTELRRACAPAGLIFPAHHVLIRTTAHALLTADVVSQREARGRDGVVRGTRSLTRWAAAASELRTDCDVQDDDLHDAVVAHTRGWARRQLWARELADGAGDLLTWSVLVELGVLRRLWHHAHGHEVEWEVPLLRAETVRLLRGAFGRHLVELLARPVDDPRDGDTTEVDAPDLRWAATLARLATRGADAVRALLDLMGRPDDERWRGAYLDALGGGGPEFLDPDEFRERVAGNRQGDEDGGD